MADITLLFPTLNRLEFTKVALDNLLENTNHELVDQLIVVDGSSEDGTAQYLRGRLASGVKFPHKIITVTEHHVVAAMMAAYESTGSPFIAKIDSDTIVPPGWLDICVDVVRRHPELWALGIEPFSPIENCSIDKRGYNRAPDFVGGIGLFRHDAWTGLKAGSPPFYGWTEHQTNSRFTKGWLHPAMPVFLLDHLPFEPFLSLSKQYVTKQWQRDWTKHLYPTDQAHRWDWKFPQWSKNGNPGKP